MGNWKHGAIQINRLGVLLSGCLAMGGCSWFGFQPPAPLEPVVIQSFGEVTGRWEGQVKPLEGGPIAWVTVSITDRARMATFAFVGTGRQAPFLGTGQLQLQGGRLLTEGEARTLTFTLAERSGARLLIVSGIGKDGQWYHAVLTRVE